MCLLLSSATTLSNQCFTPTMYGSGNVLFSCLCGCLHLNSVCHHPIQFPSNWKWIVVLCVVDPLNVRSHFSRDLNEYSRYAFNSFLIFIAHNSQALGCCFFWFFVYVFAWCRKFRAVYYFCEKKNCAIANNWYYNEYSSCFGFFSVGWFFFGGVKYA